MRTFLKSYRLLLFLVTAGLMLYGFWGLFQRAAFVFSNEQEDLSFGWYVPLFSLFVLWTERRALAASVGKPSFFGLLACLPCFAVALLGTRGLQMRFEQLGFIGLCMTLPWAFFGRKTARLCVFPALYLVFTIPLSTFLDFVTIHLRLLASGTALAVLKGFGVAAVQQGTAILSIGSMPFSVDVAEPCSGLRSLFSLMALTAAYAWFHQPTAFRRLFLFACSIPLAILGNVMRILSICLVAAFADPAFATGFYHDYSGYVVFLVALSLMVGVDGMMTRFWREKVLRKNTAVSSPLEAPTAEEPPVLSGDFSHAWKGPLVSCLLLGGLFVFQAHTPESVVAQPPSVVLPESLPGYQTDGIRYCLSEKCNKVFLLSRLGASQTNCPACGSSVSEVSLGEKTILPSDTRILKRVYRSSDGFEYLVSAVIGGREKGSIHRPELCLPAQGFIMTDPVNFVVKGRPFHALHVSSAGRPSAVLCYTFFNQAGLQTASHTRRIFADTWDRSVFNRVDRWVMITINALAPESADGFRLDTKNGQRTLEEFVRVLFVRISEGEGF